ncbi:MAG: tetratricopeptide repeat protein [Candidatus Saccharibacteria bacterium]|nr:tetratricopeptide repeat protein [Candidatus Saccharibacteria bacterium]
MLGILLILFFSLYLAILYPLFAGRKKNSEQKDPKRELQMKKLWSIAQSSMRERKPMRAEKALLTILKFDEKNAAAYNRLGILYAKDQKYDEAIECFEIAQSLDSNASSLHNVGLIYLETGAYEKAAMAFHQALELEGDLPARYIALAKAEEKMGNRKNAIEALETAYDLDHSTATLRQILAIYEAAEDTEMVTATTARIEAQIAENSKRRERTTSASRRASRLSRERATRMVSRPVPRPAPSIERRAAITSNRHATVKTQVKAPAATPRAVSARRATLKKRKIQ